MKTNKVSLVIALCTLCSVLLSCTNKSNTTPPDSTLHDTATAAKQVGQSIYQLEGSWTTQNNKIITLANLKGKAQVIVMVFTHCRYACPHIVGDMKEVAQQLPAEIKNNVGFTIVSFDTKRDTVAALKEFAKEMNLDSSWTLLHGTDDEIRELAMLLDVSYNKLPNGDFNHTSVITVLNKQGVIMYRHEGLVIDVRKIVGQVEAALE